MTLSCVGYFSSHSNTTTALPRFHAMLSRHDIVILRMIFNKFRITMNTTDMNAVNNIHNVAEMFA